VVRIVVQDLIEDPLVTAIIDGGRCRKGVDHGSDKSPKLVPIDEQPNHEIVHALCLGEAQCTADESLDPGPQIEVFALDCLRVLLAHLRLLGSEMPLVGPPAICGKLRDAKRFQQLLELQEDVVFPSPNDIRSYLAWVMINGMPPPARMRFAPHVTPHVVQC
jgi:hypothetical protein